MNYPKIYLAIDNCFASKRWTKPEDWMKVISELGLNYIECSADNECDPLYSGTNYLRDWKEEVISCCLVIHLLSIYNKQQAILRLIFHLLVKIIIKV